MGKIRAWVMSDALRPSLVLLNWREVNFPLFMAEHAVRFVANSPSNRPSGLCILKSRAEVHTPNSLRLSPKVMENRQKTCFDEDKRRTLHCHDYMYIFHLRLVLIFPHCSYFHRIPSRKSCFVSFRVALPVSSVCPEEHVQPHYWSCWLEVNGLV